MHNKGFYISRVIVAGPDKEPAEVKLTPGANVITGLSDTGKSYIFETVNYMFGAKARPEIIDESAGYEEIFVELCRFDLSESFTLQRTLGGSEFRLYRCSWDQVAPEQKAEILKSTQQKQKDNISSFLLELSGFPQTVHLKTKAAGDTSLFSFRVLWDFVSTNEIDILKKESPIFNGRPTDSTRQKKAFEYIITGNSEADKIRTSSTKVLKNAANIAGQLEFCIRLIEELAANITALQSKRATLAKSSDVATELKRLTEQIEIDGKQIAILIEQRNKLTDSIEALNSKTRSIAQMNSRFELLREHYRSDLKRLDFVSEVHYLLAQLQNSTCPTCGQGVANEKHQHEEQQNISDELIQQACKNEEEKILRLLSELEETFENLNEEKAVLNAGISNFRQDAENIEIHLREKLSPKWTADKQKLDQLVSLQVIDSELLSMSRRLTVLQQTKAELSKKAKEDISQTVSTTTPDAPDSREDSISKALKNFSSSVDTLVKNWQFANEDVSFDRTTWDIRVGSKDRKSFGKGKRAVLFAAFVIGLLNFCRGAKLAHPGFVIIDSPLTAHRGKLVATEGDDDDDDEIPEAVKDAFFEQLCVTKKDRQVIILDNKAPTREQQAKINTVVFTGDIAIHRTGFFPS